MAEYDGEIVLSVNPEVDSASTNKASKELGDTLFKGISNDLDKTNKKLAQFDAKSAKAANKLKGVQEELNHVQKELSKISEVDMLPDKEYQDIQKKVDKLNNKLLGVQKQMSIGAKPYEQNIIQRKSYAPSIMSDEQKQEVSAKAMEAYLTYNTKGMKLAEEEKQIRQEILNLESRAVAMSNSGEAFIPIEESKQYLDTKSKLNNLLAQEATLQSQINQIDNEKAAYLMKQSELTQEYINKAQEANQVTIDWGESASISQMENAKEKVNSAIDAIKNRLQSLSKDGLATSGANTEFIKLSTELKKLENDSSELEASIKDTSGGIVESLEALPKSQALESEINKFKNLDDQAGVSAQKIYENIIKILEGKRLLLEAQGNKGTEEYNNILAALEKVNVKYNEATINVRAMSGEFQGASGRAKMMAAQIRNSMSEALIAFKNAHPVLTGVGKLLSGTVKTGFQLVSNSAKLAAKGTMALGKSALNAARGLATMAKNAASSAFSKLKDRVTSIGKSTSKAANTFSGLAKKMIFAAIGVRSIYFAFRKLATAVKEGISQMAKMDPSGLGASLNSLKANLGALKGAWGAAFSPIIQAVAPLLNSLISMLTSAANAIGQFFAVLTGKGTFMKAKKALGGVASGASGAGKAAKKARGELAAFDDINVLNPKDDDGSGSGGGGGGGSGADFGVETIEATSEFAKNLREAFENENWTGIGEIIAQKLNDTMSIVNDWINNTFRPLGEKWAFRVAEILNGLTSGLDWELLGDTISDGLTATFSIANKFLTTYKFDKLGEGIGRALKSAFDNKEMWAQAGMLFANKWNALFHTLEGIFSTPGLGGSLGKGLATWVNNMIAQIDLASAGRTFGNMLKVLLEGAFEFVKTLNTSSIGTKLSDGMIALFNSVGNVLTTFDWKGFGNTIYNKLKDLVTNVDWQGVMTSLSTAIGGLIGGVAGLLGGFIEQLWIDIKQYFKDYIPDFSGDESVLDMGISIINGVFQGISDAIKNISKWVNDNIFQPFIKAFKKAFGIASPSKKMKTMGGYIMQGLFNGLTEKLGKLSEIASKVWSKIKDAFKNVKEWFGTTFNNAKEAAANKWNDIKSKFDAKWTNIKNAFSNVKTWFGETFSSAKDNAVNKWADIKSKFSEKWTNIKDAFANVGTWFGNTFSGAKDAAVKKWDDVKTKFGTAWTNVKNAFSGVSKWFGDTFKEAKDASVKKWDTIKTSFSTVWGDVKKGFTEGSEGIGSWFKNTFSKAKDNAVSAWDNAKSKFSGVADNVKSAFSGILDKLGLGTPSVKSDYSAEVKKIKDQFTNSLNGVSLGRLKVTVPQIKYTGQSSSGLYTPTVNSAIPLATGGVIPPNSPFLALLGDQKQGVNIETPLSTMVDAFRTAAQELVGNSGSSNNYAEMTLDGQTFARLIVPYVISELHRVGYNTKVLED